MITKYLKNLFLCCGCSACKQICPQKCIDMKQDNEGFFYPDIDEKNCIYCRKCIEVCPIVYITKNDNISITYASMNRDESTRINSSSGGLFTLFGEEIIRIGGVIFGCALNNSYQIEHIIVNTKEGLYKLQGSKYVQSNIGDSYKQVLNFLRRGKYVYFSGTPCQIEGLYSYLSISLKNSYEIDKLITQDLICHGVPSPIVWQTYLEETFKDEEIKSISFRDKSNGWNKFGMRIRTNKQTYYKSLEQDPFLKSFLGNLSLRPSCYDCKFKTLHRKSDITLADFWGIEKFLNEMADNKGTSLVFLNTIKGLKMFESIKDKMYFQKVNFEDSIVFNSTAIKSAHLPKKRKFFFNHLAFIEFDKLVMICTKKSWILKMKYSIKKIFKNIINIIPI